jgi:hypothetical protein
MRIKQNWQSIIEFSNQHFYEGRLRVATKYDRLRRPGADHPAIRWIETQGKVVRPSSGGAVNEDEARAVVRELERLVLGQGYAGTIGVVSPFRAHRTKITMRAQLLLAATWPRETVRSGDIAVRSDRERHSQSLWGFAAKRAGAKNHNVFGGPHE